MMMERLDRFLSFDTDRGIVTAEGGVTLEDLLRVTVPKGWFPPVVPGTRHVTLGGCVASDVHGKNHHREGSFGNHVLSLRLVLADGSEIDCSPEGNRDLFRATLGGMGLTGIIAEVTIRLKRISTAALRVQHQPLADIDEALDALDASDLDDEYSVAWIDALHRGRRPGRGVLIRGHHAAPAETSAEARTSPDYRPGRVLQVPDRVPSFLMNTVTGRIFNRRYYRKEGGRSRPFSAGIDDFFFPLDRLRDWNRLYGKPGFFQYQFTAPGAAGRRLCRDALALLADSGVPCFLAVLKRFGPTDNGPLSFPREGYTLALDLPNRGSRVRSLMDELDERVIRAGGRVYLAKDARLNPDAFRRMYRDLPTWRRTKEALDPEEVFSSDLSRRVGLTREP